MLQVVLTLAITSIPANTPATDVEADHSVALRLISGDVFGQLSTELRAFPFRSEVDDRLSHTQASIAGELGYSVELGDDTTFRFVAFARGDQADSARTHFDVRELWLETFVGNWMVGAGLGKVFWGVTESRHLVDIVNQTDLVENLDGEDKLGQPMVRLSVSSARWGTLDLFWISALRERTFGGRSARFGPPLRIADDAEYESSLGRGHVDLAARWSHTLGDADVGVSYFYGTSRDPKLNLRLGDTGPVLVPQYDLIHQAGLDAQWTTGGWLLKLESIVREGQGSTFAAVTGGFEYTFTGLVGTADLGVLGEFNYDGRNNGTFVLLDNDAFGGMRLAFNDEQSTQILAGAAVDIVTGSVFASIEGSRRLWDSFTIGVEARLFFATDETDPAYGLRRDDYAQVELAYHF